MAGPQTGTRATRDVIAALAVIAASAGFGWLAIGYGVGTNRQMGAGYFPLVLSAVAAALGLVLLAIALVSPAPQVERLDPRRLLWTSAALVVFALAVKPMGLFLSVAATVLIASLAYRDTRPLESLLLATGMATAVSLLFVMVLRLPMHLWPGGA